MRLLLFGCTGFIGLELIPKLLSSGHHLTLVSRKSPSKFRSEQIIHLQLDPADPKSWRNELLIKALAESNGIINLAGEPIAEKRWTEDQCKEIELSRINTTKELINAMQKLKKPPQVLLSGSAIGFYGTSPKNIYNEDSPSGEDFLARLCKKWELIAREKPKSTRLVILRIGIVLGADGGALGKMLPVFRAGFGGPIGDGKQWMSWIHRSDLCQIIEKALSDKRWEGAINAVAPNPTIMANFSESLGQSLGRPSLLPVPGPLLKLLLGDGAKVVLEGQNVLSNRLKKLKFEFQYPKLDKALKAITSSS